MITDLIALAGYLAFLGLAALVTFSRADRDRRRRASLLVAFVAGAGLLAAVSDRNLWPFSSWRMMPRVAPGSVGPDLPLLRVTGLTASGAEYRIDPRSFAPLTWLELGAWLHYRINQVSAAAGDSAGARLLQAANAARESVRAGRLPSEGFGLPGLFRAPSHYLFARLWIRPDDVPAEPFVEIRAYHEEWSVEERARDLSSVRLTLFYRYQAP